MRSGSIVLVLLLVGCGARVEPDPSDGTGAGVSGEDGGAGAGSALGCPLTPPPSGQACGSAVGLPGEHFYCHYFMSGSSCAKEAKCTDKGSGPSAFIGGLENCTLDPSACNEGKDCGYVSDPSGACIVECTRACTCSAGKLSCKPTPCSK